MPCGSDTIPLMLCHSDPYDLIPPLLGSDVVSTWSSGTGFSGVLGSFSYAALINAGLSPRNTLFVMLICPVIMTIT